MTNLKETAVNATTDQQGQNKIATDQQGQQTKQLSNQPKKRKGMPLFWKVLAKANRAFETQITISNTVKRQCIERLIGSPSCYPDTQKFWAEYMKYVERLLDSNKFNRDCKRLNATAENVVENVAEHIVFLGNRTIKNVLNNGLENTLGKVPMLYVERLTPEVANVFRNEAVSTVAK